MIEIINYYLFFIKINIPKTLTPAIIAKENELFFFLLFLSIFYYGLYFYIVLKYKL